jgi:hypothetical protein
VYAYSILDQLMKSKTDVIDLVNDQKE